MRSNLAYSHLKIRDSLYIFNDLYIAPDKRRHSDFYFDVRPQLQFRITELRLLPEYSSEMNSVCLLAKERNDLQEKYICER